MIGHEDGKIEVSVGGVIMLATLTVVATAIVFLLGVYVGKGVTEERLSSEQRVVRLPAPESPEAGAPAGGEQVSFWDRLNDDEDEPAPAAPEPTPTETSVRVAPPPAAAATATPKPTPTAVPTATRAPAPPPTPTTVAALRGTFQVQVQALADKAAAERIARDLRSRGYESRLSPAKVGSQTLYRVRVGPFATEDEARAAIARLQGQGFPGAFLAAGGD